MAKNLTFEYDKVGDTLSISVSGARPYAEQDSEFRLDENSFVCFNPKTGEVEYLEILFFNARLEKRGVIEIDLTPDAEIIAANKTQPNSKDAIHDDRQNGQASESVSPAHLTTDC